MKEFEHISYFGYGSLVNLETLRTPYLHAHPAVLRGWRRVWLARPDVHQTSPSNDNIAFLSVRRDAGSQIDGLLIYDHASSLLSLDAREALYRRTRLSHADLLTPDRHADKLVETKYLYVADEQEKIHSKRPPAILRSYLDAVMQGFLLHFGCEGLARFIATTDNFHFPVLEDRSAPRYPRHVELSAKDQSTFDGLIPRGGLK